MAESKIDPDILDGDALRVRLERELSQVTKSVKFISAYITQSGIDWLDTNSPQNADVQIVCRLLPSDVLSGASQLSALKTALEKGYKVACLHSLHAKIYCLDDAKIYAGSANFTNNGLKIYGDGNLEANVQVSANKSNLTFIENIIASATMLHEETLKKMQSCIDLREEQIFFDRWPEGVLQEKEGIWVRDFFWGAPGADQISREHIHDLEIMGLDSLNHDFSVLKTQVANVRCIRWLLNILKEAENNEMYFGALTQLLHDQLKDDPAPYRKDVKMLLQNMLSYCELYLTDKVEITRPNHSQKIRLLVAS